VIGTGSHNRLQFRFRTKGKVLFLVAAFICLISIFLSPAGIVFIYMALTAEIVIDDDSFRYRMLRKRVVPFQEIEGITIGRPQKPAYYVSTDAGGYSSISFATVIPLIIELHGDRKLKLSLNYFEDPAAIIRTLRDRTGLVVRNETGEDIPF